MQNPTQRGKFVKISRFEFKRTRNGIKPKNHHRKPASEIPHIEKSEEQKAEISGDYAVSPPLSSILRVHCKSKWISRNRIWNSAKRKERKRWWWVQSVDVRRTLVKWMRSEETTPTTNDESSMQWLLKSENRQLLKLVGYDWMNNWICSTTQFGTPNIVFNGRQRHTWMFFELILFPLSLRRSGACFYLRFSLAAIEYFDCATHSLHYYYF